MKKPSSGPPIEWWKPQKKDPSQGSSFSPTFWRWAIGLVVVAMIFKSQSGHVTGDTPILGLLQIAVGGGLAWFAYQWWIAYRTPTSVKNKPDDLGSSEMASEAASKLHHREEGIWAGKAGDGLDLYASIEDRAVVLGPPGAGKTAFLVAQLLRWAETKRSFVCLDSKPEIFGITRKALERLGYKTIVYNPTEGRGQRYNPLVDIDGPEAIGELAAALIPAVDDANPIFTESARDLLDALISHLRAIDGEASLPSIRTLIASVDDYKGLLRTLAASPDPDAADIARSLAMTSANERLLGSILGTLRANLRFLRYPHIRASLETSDFSSLSSRQISLSHCFSSSKSISVRPRRICSPS